MKPHKNLTVCVFKNGYLKKRKRKFKMVMLITRSRLCSWRPRTINNEPFSEDINNDKKSSHIRQDHILSFFGMPYISFLSETLYSVYTVGVSMGRVSMVAAALPSEFSFYSHSFYLTMNYQCKFPCPMVRLHFSQPDETQVVQQALRFCSLLGGGHLSKIIMGLTFFLLKYS